MSCIHCGLCLSSCPTYLETGNENDSPRGRIYLMRALQEGRLELGAAPVRHIDLCLGCRACEAACPSGVPYGELLEHARDHIEKHHSRPWFQRFLRRVAIERIFPYPQRMRWALLPARLVKALGMDAVCPAWIRDALALIPESPSSIPIPAVVNPEGTRRVGFISGCVMSVMFGETHRNSLELLARAGFQVATPSDQVCCGALHAHSGRLDQARAFARRNIEVFEKAGVEMIVINAAGCGSTLKEYGQLLAEDPMWRDRATAFSSKVRDLSEILAEREWATPTPCASDAPIVTFHDACHLAHAQRITQPPRKMVKAAAGERYVEMPESDVCCGSAGSYNLTEPEMAARLRKRKIENILKSGAQIVVTSNPGCLLQIQAGLRAEGADHVRALHIADFLVSDRAGWRANASTATAGDSPDTGVKRASGESRAR
ncbi:MAG: 4Fe-4S dicluster domain-containing protein [Verrucomicrobia bacterium]|nr:4Fe-4S dicluster domain-containing protein [Verrucomicrobiota bacterium]